MLEIELKYPLSDPDALRTALKERGALLMEQREDADQYYNAPDRDFAKTDEAFRIRCIGSRNLLTYKGPKIEAQTKTRKEIEVAAADGTLVAVELRRLFVALGYRPVAIVLKRREVFELNRDGFSLHICLDNVDRVGTFAEIEIVADEAQLEEARSAILMLADELGLKQSERKSYLQLLLERTGVI